MAKSGDRLKAQQLRRKGKSIKDIAAILGVSSGSVSAWCQSIQLTQEQGDRLRRAQIIAGHKGRMIGAEMNRRKRLQSIDKQESLARRTIGKLSKRDRLMLGVALYWGEGVKARSSATAIVNSDPEAILFARNWFEQLGVSRAMFRPSVFISELHKYRESIVVDFWSKLLEIPKEQFAKVVFLKGARKKVYENHNSYYGVMALRVRKGGELKQRIIGFIRACKKEAGVAQMVGAQHS